MMRLGLIVVLALALAPRVAFADDAWASGVTQAQQDRANELFAAGNELFARGAHAAALEQYRAALALWDHPLIRLNAAVAELRVDRILEAADDLDHALAYGAQPFPTAALYQQALDYQRLVQARVGTLQASCTQPTVHVVLDGAPWFECPGTRTRRVVAGEHVLAASDDRQELAPQSQRVVVAGTTSATIALEPPATNVRLVAGKVSVGVGAALVGLAVGVGLYARHEYRQAFEDGHCASGVCDAAGYAKTQNAIGIGWVGTGLGVVGIATAGVGAVLWATSRRSVTVVPTVEPTHAGLAAVGRF
jgi:tetratricopeptide (TPR) repeat protein